MTSPMRLVSKGLLITACLAFIVMYATLSFYNRLVFDDFAVVASALKLGWIGGVISWYTTLDGCLSTVVIHQAVEPLLFHSGAVYLFNYLTICLLIISLFLFLRTYLSSLGISYGAGLLLVSTTIFVSLFYLTSPHITQCFYWTSSIIPYIYPFIFLFLALFFLLRSKSLKHFIPACILFFLFGQTRVHFVFPVLCLIGLYIAFQFVFKKNLDKRTIVIFLIVCAGMAIAVIAPGNYKRKAVEATLGLSHPSFSYSLKFAIQKISAKFFLENLRYYVLAIPFGLLLGALLKQSGNKISEQVNKAFNLGILRVAAGLVFFNASLLLLNAAIMYVAVKNCYYTDRVWMHLAFSILTSIGILSLILGFRFSSYASVYKYISCLSLVYLTYVFVKSTITILPYEKEYARVYDLNVSLMKQAREQKRTEVLYLHPMPANSGFIQEWHVKSDTAFWVNQCLAFDYGLSCAVSDSTK